MLAEKLCKTIQNPSRRTPKPMTQASHCACQYAAIAEVLRRYYDGLYHGNTALLRLVSHPQARYVTASCGELLHLDLENHLPVVAARTPAAQAGSTHLDN